jgi:hypothetical protein
LLAEIKGRLRKKIIFLRGDAENSARLGKNSPLIIVKKQGGGPLRGSASLAIYPESLKKTQYPLTK